MNTNKYDLRQRVKKSMKVAADIGSERHYVLMRHPDGRCIKRFSIKNNREGFKKLYTRIKRRQEIWNLNDVTFGMESTGNYTEGVGNYLSEKGIRTVLINGYHTKRVKEISDNSPLKSDDKDPTVIADIMELGCVMRYWKPEGPAAELRYLNKFRGKVEKKRVETLNQIYSSLILVFPEFLEAVGSLKTKTVQYLITHGFHNPEAVINCDIQELALQVRKVSRGKKNEETMLDLLNAAKQTTGIKEGLQSVLKEISWSTEELVGYDKKLTEIEAEMEKYCNEVPYSKYLFSIKGVGLVTVSGIIGEIGDFDRFNNIKEVEKYAGLNLYEVSSGKLKGTRRITKRGRSYLRAVLYKGALNQVRLNPSMKKWYKKMKDEGKNSFSGLIAVARKLLRICYGMVKTQTFYNEETVKMGRMQQKKVA